MHFLVRLCMLYICSGHKSTTLFRTLMITIKQINYLNTDHTTLYRLINVFDERS